MGLLKAVAYTGGLRGADLLLACFSEMVFREAFRAASVLVRISMQLKGASGMSEGRLGDVKGASGMYTWIRLRTFIS